MAVIKIELGNVSGGCANGVHDSDRGRIMLGDKHCVVESKEVSAQMTVWNTHLLFEKIHRHAAEHLWDSIFDMLLKQLKAEDYKKLILHAKQEAFAEGWAHHIEVVKEANTAYNSKLMKNPYDQKT